MQRAKKREKLVSEKSEKGTIETPTEANPGEQLFDEDEPFPPIDVAGYGLDLVEAQVIEYSHSSDDCFRRKSCLV